MIWSLVIAYQYVGGHFQSLHFISWDNCPTSNIKRPIGQHTCTKIVLFLKMAMNLFHGCLGINEDRTVDEGVFTVSEDVLINRGKK